MLLRCPRNLLACIDALFNRNNILQSPHITLVAYTQHIRLQYKSHLRFSALFFLASFPSIEAIWKQRQHFETKEQ